jgi:hypothetical protein
MPLQILQNTAIIPSTIPATILKARDLKLDDEIADVPNGTVQGGPSNKSNNKEGLSEKKLAEDDRSITASPPVVQLVIPYHLPI